MQPVDPTGRVDIAIARIVERLLLIKLRQAVAHHCPQEWPAIEDGLRRIYGREVVERL